MKKFLSLLLATCVSFSVIPCALAQNNEEESQVAYVEFLKSGTNK